MNLFGRSEPQPKQERDDDMPGLTVAERVERIRRTWDALSSEKARVDMSNQYRERGMDSWYFSTPGLVEEVRQSGYTCISDDSTIYHSEAAFWTDLKLEHGKPVYLKSGRRIVRYGTMVGAVEDHYIPDNWFEKYWQRG